MRVAIVSTGVANVASVKAAFDRCGAESFLTHSGSEVESASHVMLPGVGAFGPGMKALRDHQLVDALVSRVAEDRPTMSICLGLQLLGQTSEETPGVGGLGVFEAHARRFPDSVRVPHFGWNEVVAPEGARFLETGFAYFANSYRWTEVPKRTDGKTSMVATTTYDSTFYSAVESGNLLACQFHPELSGPWGLALIKRWLEASC